MSLGGKKLNVNLVWAQTINNVIGEQGKLPWDSLPEDLAHFKALTEGHAVIMGRKTWESLPVRHRPLSGRTNIVLTRETEWSAGEGATTLHSVADALVYAMDHDLEVWVIGGGQIYAEFLRHATKAVVTEVDVTVYGDTFAPHLDDSWTEFDNTGWLVSKTDLKYQIRSFSR